MTEIYTKCYSTPQELVKLLKTRGLTILDETKAEEYLRNIGYYRLSAYFYPFLKVPKSEHVYKESSSFKKVMDLYRFDRKLRLLIFNEIEKIEVAVRSAIVNITCQYTHDPFWMTNKTSYLNTHKFQSTMEIIDKEYQKSNEDFIIHFRNTYSNGYPPAWELSEILSLGVMTQIYSNIRSNKIRKKIAQQFYLYIPAFQSWMTTITLTRNSCCHHARIWNKEYTINPMLVNHMNRPWINADVNRNRIFFNLCIIKYFIDIISANNHFKQYLLDLFTRFPSIDKSAMGFPVDWEQQPLWRDK